MTSNRPRPQQQQEQEQEQGVRISLNENIKHSNTRKRMMEALHLDAQLDPHTAANNQGRGGGLLMSATAPVNGDGNMNTNRRSDTGEFVDTSQLPTGDYSYDQGSLTSDGGGGDGMIESEWRTGRDGIKEIVISSYAHFMDIITNMEDTYNPDTKKYETEFAFFGCAVKGCSLTSSLAQLEDFDSDEIAAMVEAGLIKNFSRFCEQSAPELITPATTSNLWAMLALMQHNGCPTRLLEWTLNPNVALYFAVENHSYAGEDGEVWFVKPSALAKCQDGAYCNAQVQQNAWCPTYLQQQSLLDSFEPSVDPSHMVETIRKFDELSGEGSSPTLSFFIPPMLDARMRNQSSVFSVASSPLLSADEVLSRHPGSVRRMVVPSFLKGVLHDTLDFMGVHERILFPGLGGLSAALTRYFTRDARPSPEEIGILFRHRRAEMAEAATVGEELAGRGSSSDVLLHHAEGSIVSGIGTEPRICAEAIFADNLNNVHNNIAEEKAELPVECKENVDPTMGVRVPLQHHKSFISPPHEAPDTHALSTGDDVPSTAAETAAMKKAAEGAHLFIQVEQQRIARNQRMDVLSRIEEIMREEIGFKKSEAVLTAGGKKGCKQISEVLLEYPELVVHIECHTNCCPSDELNCDKGCCLSELSQQRVDTIRAELEKIGCINSFKIKGWGCKHPELGSIRQIRIFPEDVELENPGNAAPQTEAVVVDSTSQPLLASQEPLPAMVAHPPDEEEGARAADLDDADSVFEQQNVKDEDGLHSSPQSLRMMSLAFNNSSDVESQS